MSLWGRIFATAYDRIMSGAEEGGLAAHRRRATYSCLTQ
jgi:hypothetical protein